MNEIQIRNLDLNLLLVFRTLMEEGSVNRAAEQLGRTPSAVSHALGRLRDQLGDPLLVRVGGVMTPSPRAEALYAEVKPILQRIERAVQPPAEFDPAMCTRVFNVAGPALNSVTTEVLRRMRAEAPDAGLAWMPATKDSAAQLARDEVDLMFGNANFPAPDGLKAKGLPPMKRYVFSRRGHPAVNDWTTEAWLRWPHVVVRIPAAIHGTVEERLTSLGLTRRIGLHAPNWSGIAQAIDATDMLGNFVPLCLLEERGADLQILAAPEPLPDLAFRVLWNGHLDGDPAISWLRGILLDTFDHLIAKANTRVAAADVIQPRH